MSARDTFIRHVTLQTGHVRDSYRSEVGDETVAALAPLLDRALTGEYAGLPRFPGYTITGGVYGRCCAVTLWCVIPDTVGPERAPVLTTGVAGHSRCAGELWRSLHEMAGGPLATRPDRSPPVPWCADLMAGLALHPEAAEWTGDYSRCVAWTWLGRRGSIDAETED